MLLREEEKKKELTRKLMPKSNTKTKQKGKKLVCIRVLDVCLLRWLVVKAFTTLLQSNYEGATRTVIALWLQLPCFRLCFNNSGLTFRAERRAREKCIQEGPASKRKSAHCYLDCVAGTKPWVRQRRRGEQKAKRVRDDVFRCKTFVKSRVVAHDV